MAVPASAGDSSWNCGVRACVCRRKRGHRTAWLPPSPATLPLGIVEGKGAAHARFSGRVLAAPIEIYRQIPKRRSKAHGGDIVMRFALQSSVTNGWCQSWVAKVK